MRDGPTDPGEDPGNSEEDHSGDVYIAADGLEELHVNGHQPAPPPVDRPTIPQDQDRAPAAGGDGAGAGMDTIVVTGHKPKTMTSTKPITPAQSQTPAPPPPMPKPCYAARGNNPVVLRNIGIVGGVGAIGFGVLAAVNIVGFPEAEAIEGIGGLLGAMSAMGDPFIVGLSYAIYGATGGGVLGFAITPQTCAGN